MRVQISHNPADSEHWVSLLAEEPEDYMTVQDDDGAWVTIQKKTFWIPRGENKNLSALTRAANMAAFKDDPAKWERYVEGHSASVHLGKKVTPGYSKAIHFAPDVLPVYKGEGVQMWDSYQHPACVLAQYNPLGQLVIHDVCVGEQTAAKELIAEKVDPLLQTPKWKDKITSWRIIGDTTMKTPDQSTVNMTTARRVEEHYNSRFEGGPAHWHTIKESLNPVFKRLLDDGKPVVVLSRSAVVLHRALKGGWHYKTDNNGNIMGDKPVKDHHSHPGDAFANGIAVLMPHSVQKQFRLRSQQERMRRAMSYRGGNYSKQRQSFAAGV